MMHISKDMNSCEISVTDQQRFQPEEDSCNTVNQQTKQKHLHLSYAHVNKHSGLINKPFAVYLYQVTVKLEHDLSRLNDTITYTVSHS